MPQSPGSVPCTLLRVPNGPWLRFVNLYIEWENCPEKPFFMEKLHKKLYALKESERIVFVHGTGKKI